MPNDNPLAGQPTSPEPTQQSQQPQQPQFPPPSMHRQTTSTVVQQAKNASADATSAKLDTLLSILVSREARVAQQEEGVENTRKARNAQRELSAKTHVEKTLIKQARCRHIKGGKHGPKSGVIDYAVYHHTYINGENIIKCFICGMKWKAQDTVDFLIRGGRQIANHTKIGWAQAKGFLAQSTNKPSSSEVPMEAKSAVPFNGVEV